MHAHNFHPIPPPAPPPPPPPSPSSPTPYKATRHQPTKTEICNYQEKCNDTCFYKNEMARDRDAYHMFHQGGLKSDTAFLGKTRIQKGFYVTGIYRK